MSVIESSAYSPAQKFYLVKVIVNVFRYSAILLSWSWKDLQSLDNLWTRAFKRAMGLSKSTSNIVFRLPYDRGGLQLPHPAPILGRMALRYLEKETNRKSRVEDDIQGSLINKLTAWVTNWGCQTISQVQREIRCRISENAEIRGPERIAIWIAEKLKTTISWELIENKMIPGSISILHEVEDRMSSEEISGTSWMRFQKAWRQLPQAGYSSRTNVLPISETEGISLHLPIRRTLAIPKTKRRRRKYSRKIPTGECYLGKERTRRNGQEETAD